MTGKPQKRRFRDARLSEQVLVEILRMIADEYRTPGSRLPREAELADRFQVSRIVIREAMKILEDRGVVQVRAGRGTLTLAPTTDRVKNSLLWLFSDRPVPTVQEMEHMLELRQPLEEAVASFAAVRATEEDLAEIEAALQKMTDNAAGLQNTIADICFHRAITRAAHNPFFEMVLDPLMEAFLQQMKLTNSFQMGRKLHHDVFLEIQKRNPVGARQAVRRLMKQTLEDCRSALTQLSGSSAPAK